MRTKTSAAYYKTNDYQMLQKFMKSTSDSEQAEITKSAERQKKLVFQKNM